MTTFSKIIEGREWKLETTRDLDNVQFFTQHPDLCCIRTDEGREHLKTLLSEYQAAGSPQLQEIDRVRERIEQAVSVELFIGRENMYCPHP